MNRYQILKYLNPPSECVKRVINELKEYFFHVQSVYENIQIKKQISSEKKAKCTELSLFLL